MSDCEEKRKMKGLAPCKSDKICNPKTGRCVLKSGRIGKALLKKFKSKRKSVRKSKSRRKSVRKSKSRRKSVRKSKKRKSVRKSKKSRKKSVRKRRKSVRKSKIKSKSKPKKLKKNQLPYKGDIRAAMRARDMKAMQQIQVWNAQQFIGDIRSSSSSEEVVEGEGILNRKVFDYITGKNTTIGKWLRQSPENFVMEVAPGKWEICGIELMRMALRMNVNPNHHPNVQLFSELWQSLFKIWYECPRSGVGPHLPRYYRGPQINTDADHQFVKIGTANWVVLRPYWFPEGEIPGSRIFRLEKLRKVNGLVSNYAREGNMSRLNMMSVDHCNQKSPIQTYRLVEYY
jgi:hypothetical protein